MPGRCDSDKIRQKMKQNGMTVRKLIDTSKLSESTIRRILSGKEYTTLDATIELLAAALNCSPYDIMRDEEIERILHGETQPNTGEEAEQETHDGDAQLAYVEHIVKASTALVDNHKRTARNWRTATLVLAALLVVLSIYFFWEIFNPHLGITSVLWNVYSSATPPGVLATVPPV